MSVIRYGYVKHTIPWEKIEYVEVFAMVSRTYRPWIVCAKKGWPFKLDIADLMILKPFSMCIFQYSPERVEALENRGISVHYRTPYGKVMQMYEEI